MTVPDEVLEYARGVGARLADVFEDDLVGAYLHGSGAMGGWSPARSDVDILAVAGRSATRTEKEDVARALRDPHFVAPGTGLEFSLVTRPSFEHLTASPPFELHITTGLDAKVIDGAGHRGDSDLVLHYAVCRERGLAITGPPPESVLPAVPRPMVLAQLREELRWAVRHAQPDYTAQNALRAWAFAEEGRMLSKLEGTQWAIRTGRIPMQSAGGAGSSQAGGAGLSTLIAGAMKALADD